MAGRLFVFVVLSVCVSQGTALTEVWLDDSSTTFITNPLIPKTIAIPKSFLDTLRTCHVLFPNGIIYEAYPNDNLPHDTIYYLAAVPPFNSCSIGFRNSPVSLSGTYQLMSRVIHPDNSETMFRARFHLTFVESAGIWNSKMEVQPAVVNEV